MVFLDVLDQILVENQIFKHKLSKAQIFFMMILLLKIN
jgi:hypothetical protein